jgi:hypothetical protein
LIARKKQEGIAAVSKVYEGGRNPDSISLIQENRNFKHYDMLAQQDNRSTLIDVDFSTWPRCMIADEQRIYYHDMTPGDKCALWADYWRDKKKRGHFFVNRYWRFSSKVALR